MRSEGLRAAAQRPLHEPQRAGHRANLQRDPFLPGTCCSSCPSREFRPPWLPRRRDVLSRSTQRLRRGEASRMRQLSFETNFRDSLSWEIGRPDVRNGLVLDVVSFETPEWYLKTGGASNSGTCECVGKSSRGINTPTLMTPGCRYCGSASLRGECAPVPHGRRCLRSRVVGCSLISSPDPLVCRSSQ